MKLSRRTPKTWPTRKKIGDAIIFLLEKNELPSIKIAAIAETAGISRMTFYHYYDTKEEVIMDYFGEIISRYIEESKEKGLEPYFRTIEHLEFALKYFSRYGHFLLKLEQIGYYNLLIDGVNDFLETNYKVHFGASIYNLYFYAGALLNTFLKWIQNGKKETPKEIATVILNNAVGTI